MGRSNQVKEKAVYSRKLVINASRYEIITILRKVYAKLVAHKISPMLLQITICGYGEINIDFIPNLLVIKQSDSKEKSIQFEIVSNPYAHIDKDRYEKNVSAVVEKMFCDYMQNMTA